MRRRYRYPDQNDDPFVIAGITILCALWATAITALVTSVWS